MVIAPADPRWQWANRNCKFETGFKLILGAVEPESQRVFPPKKRVPTVVTVKELPPMMNPVEEAPHVDAPVAPAAPVIPSVGVPDTAVNDIKKLMPADGNATGITVMLAVVGVAGGGAAFKFYQNWQKGRQEVEMKKLEIEEKKVEKQDNDHKACSASRAMLEAKVAEQASQLAALTSKLAEVEAKASKADGLSLEDIDLGEMKDRLEKLEASLKDKKAKKKA